MTALTGNQQIAWSPADEYEDPVYGGVHIYAGAAVGIDSSGYLRPMVSGVTLKSRGVAVKEVNNTAGASGDVRCKSRAFAYWFKNSAGAAITAANIGGAAYFEDDATVRSNSNSGAAQNGGRILMVDAHEGVLVALGTLFSVDGDLVAASNLSDVSNAATARANIGANKLTFRMGSVSTKASDSGVLYFPVPVTGTITRMDTVINGALATADATIQLQYGANVGALANVGSTTTGRATITQAGSAAGDVDTATPLTTNIAVTAGGLLKAVVAGGSTATGTAEVIVTITY